MAIFKDVGSAKVTFTLSSGQGGARTLEIATTLAFAGGRPQVTINNWTSDNPAAPSQPDSRGVTRGTWRGNVSFLRTQSRYEKADERIAEHPVLVQRTGRHSAHGWLDEYVDHQCHLGFVGLAVSVCNLQRTVIVASN